MKVRRRTYLTAIAALVALVALPAAAQARTKKFDSMVAWTSSALPQSDSDPLLFGTVTSDSAKCVKGRKVKITDETEATLTKTTDADGIFSLSLHEVLETLPGYVYDTELLKKRFGRKRRSLCKGDTATFTFASQSTPTTITDFAFDDPTNTFSGTLSSGDPVCTLPRGVSLYRFDGVDFTEVDAQTSQQGGGFSFTLPGEPAEGTWDSFAAQVDYNVFKPNGDGYTVSCGGADSNDIVIGAPTRRRAASSVPRRPADVETSLATAKIG